MTVGPYVFGLDGASHQTDPDWPLLKKQGHDFMLWKITGEDNYVNPYAAGNLRRAHDAEVITGGYDWFEPHRGGKGAPLPEGEDAANDYWRVCERIGALRKHFLLGVDFESPIWHTGPLGRNIEEYTRRSYFRLRDLIRAGNPLARVIWYTAPYYLRETGAINWGWLKESAYWIAAPGPDAMLPDDTWWPQDDLVLPWASATFHQHQWHATSKAVVGEFDRDRFKGTMAQLWALGYQGGVTPPQEAGEVQEPPADKVTTYVNAKGETIYVANMGGIAKTVLGSNTQDVGVSVVNDKGEVYDRSIKGNEFLPWKRRA